MSDRLRIQKAMALMAGAPVGPLSADDVRDAERVVQDALDGAALRRLREALPVRMTYELVWMDFADDTPSRPRIRLRDYQRNLGIVKSFDGATIAEAADKCREALK